MNVVDKIKQIVEIIEEIRTVDPLTAGILNEGLTLSFDIISEVASGKDRTTIDVSQHMEIIERILGISVEDMVTQIIASREELSDKTPDQQTLDFITSDMDDYEKFLAQNKARDDLEFLAKSI